MIVALLAPLAACTTKPIAEMSYTEVKVLADEIIERCNDQGVANGSPEMTICLRQEVGREDATRAANAQRRQAFAQALSQAGDNMQRQADRQALINAAQANRNISCRSTGFGNTVTTNCY
ncbi:hypothetical protein GTW51_08695 [Aurantimonas aggregata]|uniref:Uncharacterized protein n=1 Tax=Aurantimonas aggregata TaxID=2047720 RepID=A0A6L9MFZ7_9HYPH|nr:hypothetical protein [Aurantimonas aggregata]NDV86779.1 hypothetical protein [Aurantimonas aggregata]